MFLIFLLSFTISSPLLAAWINDRAPDFTLTDIDGDSISLKDVTGKVVYINFWATWCHPCRKELPELNRLAKKYENSDFIILAINIDKRRSFVDEFLRKYNLPTAKKLHILLDPSAIAVSAYNARAMPTSFIVDKTGIIRYVHLGFREQDPRQWVLEVKKLLNM